VVWRLLLVKVTMVARVELQILAEIYLAAAAVELVLLALTLIRVVQVVMVVLVCLLLLQAHLQCMLVVAAVLGFLMLAALVA
jgi:hypothetical protein